MVRFVGVENMLRLVRSIGVEPYLIGLSSYIEEDFRRWTALREDAAPGQPFARWRH